tara:strand:+ start:13660 stop:15411 length:1752 start_codon:yes stop_codon:yes gene_type:complete
VRNAGGTVLAATTVPVIVSGSWHHIEAKIFTSATVGTAEVRVDEVVVINATGLNTTASQIQQLSMYNTDSKRYAYWDDFIVRDATGTYNNGFKGDLRVATQQTVANGDTDGWTTRSIQKIGDGVLACQGTDRNEGLRYTDNAVFNVGSGDFGFSQFVRFGSLLGAAESGQLAGHYRAAGDLRSWRLFAQGSDNANNLVFAVSTDGIAETQVHAFPFIPSVGRWYHIEVSRSGTNSYMFIDGQQVGITKTDSNTYFDTSANLTLGYEELAATTAVTNAGLDGWIDCTQFDVGAPLHTANFTPPIAPIVATANTQLLLNYDDSSNTDGSTNDFTGAFEGAGALSFPGDALAYQTVNTLNPNDNDFVEASLIAATGTLELSALPLNTETVTIGATTYTFLTVLVNTANNVLIGATASDSLDNLRAAVNLEAGIGTLYGTGTVQNGQAFMSDLPDDQILATARAPGAAANTQPTTTTVTGATWSAATLLGGLDIPTNSQFLMSQLPPEVTGVAAVALVSRSFKLDSGSSEMQMSLVTGGGGVAAGSSRPVTISPVYYEDTIEQDPNTLSGLTPSTLVDAQVRLNRTV